MNHASGMHASQHLSHCFYISCPAVALMPTVCPVFAQSDEVDDVCNLYVCCMFVVCKMVGLLYALVYPGLCTKSRLFFMCAVSRQ